MINYFKNLGKRAVASIASIVIFIVVVLVIFFVSNTFFNGGFSNMKDFTSKVENGAAFDLKVDYTNNGEIDPQNKTEISFDGTTYKVMDILDGDKIEFECTKGNVDCAEVEKSIENEMASVIQVFDKNYEHETSKTDDYFISNGAYNNGDKYEVKISKDKKELVDKYISLVPGASYEIKMNLK